MPALTQKEKLNLDTSILIFVVAVGFFIGGMVFSDVSFVHSLKDIEPQLNECYQQLMEKKD